jgi:hypothetical protein
LIYWVWSREPEQITFADGCESYVIQIANELNQRFDSRIKFFGVEAWKKLVRIAVACAGCTFSTEDGELLIVRREHVDWAAEFLRRCYDNDLFRLREYVRDRRMLDETNEATNQLMQSFIRNHKVLIGAVYQSTTPITMYNLQAMSGLSPDKFGEVINSLSSNYLIKVTKDGVEATRRFRQAMDIVKRTEQRLYMKPLTQEDRL